MISATVNIRVEALSLNIPNAETIQAIEEAELLLSDPNAKRYKNTEELFAELNRA